MGHHVFPNVRLTDPFTVLILLSEVSTPHPSYTFSFGDRGPQSELSSREELKGRPVLPCALTVTVCVYRKSRAKRDSEPPMGRHRRPSSRRPRRRPRVVFAPPIPEVLKFQSVCAPTRFTRIRETNRRDSLLVGK